MARSDHEELERRIDAVVELLVSRIGHRGILTYAGKQWGVSERQTATYIRRARERLMEAAAESREAQFARALASYESLYAKQVAANRLAEARKTLDSIVRLCGLAAPEKQITIDYSKFSDEELAAEVAHELPGLIREAQRLAGGAAQTDGGPQD